MAGKIRKSEKSDKSQKRGKPNIKEALRLIESSDFRLTRPRRLLLETIFQQKGPFSAPQLEKILCHSGKKTDIDPVTIYRTLPVFQELGIIERCDFSDEMAHYEVTLHRDNKHHHHHIVCKSCKSVEELDFCILENQEELLKNLGYTNLTHRLEFSGICPRCSEN